MSNEQFLAQLEAILKDQLPAGELLEVMNYHREYFAEAGANAAAELDPPEVIAQRVLDEYYGAPARTAPPARKGPPAGVSALIVAGCVVIALVIAALVSIPHLIFRNVSSVEGTSWSDRVEISTAEHDHITSSYEESQAVYSLEDMLEVRTEDGRIIKTAKALPGFSNLTIQGDVAQLVSVRTGDSYSLSLDYDGQESWECFLEQGTLVICSQDGHHSIHTGASSGARITVTLPRGKALLSDPSISLSVGDVEVNGYSMDTCDISTGVGNIALTDVTASTLTCYVSTGDITFRNCAFYDWLECETDMGNIDAADLTVCASAEFETDAGNIDVLLTGAERDYSLDLETSVGVVKVAGRAVFKEYVSSSGDYYLDASTDLGNITVDFAS